MRPAQRAAGVYLGILPLMIGAVLQSHAVGKLERSEIVKLESITNERVSSWRNLAIHARRLHRKCVLSAPVEKIEVEAGAATEEIGETLVAGTVGAEVVVFCLRVDVERRAEDRKGFAETVFDVQVCRHVLV